ncbi:MAG: hypothetical protein QXW94_05780, partial [Desulfurococcaceae archaeon]
ADRSLDIDIAQARSVGEYASRVVKAEGCLTTQAVRPRFRGTALHPGVHPRQVRRRMSKNDGTRQDIRSRRSVVSALC